MTWGAIGGGGGGTTSATYTVTDALVIGAATTSGVRLDVEAGALAVREGDDSGYATVYASQVSVYSGAAEKLAVHTNYGFILNNSLICGWSSSSTVGAPDTGLARDSAAQVVVTNGSTGVGNLRATALIVGTADTSGVRLDLESGTLAVREGDDSAYGDVKALTVTATGVGSAAAPALACSTNYGWYVASNLLYAAVNGTVTGIYFSASALNGGAVTLQAFRINVTARTSDGTDNTDTRGLITNRGASGTVTRTLQGTSGYINWYKNVVSGQLLRVEPPAGKRFLRVSGTYEAADKYLELPYGASLLVAYDGTDCVCLSEGGTLAVEP